MFWFKVGYRQLLPGDLEMIPIIVECDSPESAHQAIADSADALHLFVPCYTKLHGDYPSHEVAVANAGLWIEYLARPRSRKKRNMPASV